MGASRGSVLGRDKLGIRALGSLVSSHKNESIRVLRNSSYKTLGKFHSFFLSFVLLLGSNWYLGDTNWYLTIFTLFRRWLELEQRLRQDQHRQDKKRLSQPLGL